MPFRACYATADEEALLNCAATECRLDAPERYGAKTGEAGRNLSSVHTRARRLS